MWALVPDGVAVQLDPLDPAGRYHPDMPWVRCPDTTKLGDRRVGGVWSEPPPPVAPSTRTISSAEFMALFTPAQTAALWSADPLLMTGAIRVILQGNANLDSPDAAGLLTLAVTKGALTEADKTRILAGQPPPAA